MCFPSLDRRRRLPSARRDRAAFTILECVVALLVFSLSVVAVGRLVRSHHELLDDVDAWSREGPTFYVLPSSKAQERALGVPAALEDEIPAPARARRRPPTSFEVTVVSVKQDWQGPKLTGRFRQVPK